MADKKKKKSYFKILKRLFLGSSLLLLIVGGVVLYKVYKFVAPLNERAQTYDLNKIDDVEVPSVIYDRNGVEIGRIYAQNRSVIPLEEIPDVVVECLIAQEDQRFWEQRGVDFVGLARGVYLNLKAGEGTQGASTMTMQLARNVFNLKEEAIERDEDTYTRKVVEICVALRIGGLYCSPAGKRFILECYLNRVPFGHGYYGIRSASLGYFGKEPMELERHEAASLIACIKNPSAISPIRDAEKNKKARDHVFTRLLAEEVIDQEEYDRLVEIPIKLNPKPLRRQTSYMYERINDEVKALIGEEKLATGGLKIFTNIDDRIQGQAESALKDQLSKIEATPGYSHQKYADYDAKEGEPEYLQGGVLVIDPQSGKVLAHVGGRDFNHNQYDYIDSAQRPVGTAILPFLYAYALEQGYTLSDLISDTPLNNRLVMIGGLEGILGEWGAESLVPEYEGEITLRRALEMSKISASIRLGRNFGITSFAEFCQKFDMLFPDEEELLTRDLLGWNPLSIRESARAYATFVNEGKLLDRFLYVSRVESNTGSLIYLQGKTDARNGYTQVIEPSTSFQVFDVMKQGITESGNISKSVQSLIDEGFQGGAKTGTPYNFADGWAFGFDKKYVCATWVGFKKGNNGAIIANGFAKDIALPIVTNTLGSLDLGDSANEVVMPETILAKDICRVSGLLATRYCFTDDPLDPDKVISTQFKEFFKQGLEPHSLCSVHLGEKDGTEFGDKFAPADGESAARPTLTVASVKPRADAVVGGDPYNAVKNAVDEEKKEKLPGNYESSVLILNENVPGEKEAKIELPKPKKLRLKVNTQKISPLYIKASN